MMKVIDKQNPGREYCDLACSNLKTNAKHPGLVFLGIAPEHLTSVMIDCQQIGWQTMKVIWQKSVQS